ncbi:MAG TPA: hypothetical protein VH062_00840 [Polyangiaceae bacterium]|nr:hypothetical protein [Polyangiaceae bacterium]
MNAMSRGTGTAGARARLTTLVAACTVACSSGIDGLHLVGDSLDGSSVGGSTHGGGDGGNANGESGGTSNGGNGGNGDVTANGGGQGEGGNAETGGSADSGGNGGSGNDPGGGGATAGGGVMSFVSGGRSNGGNGNGGRVTTGGTAGAGMSGSGGASNGGSAGMGMGGSGMGGVGTGGMGAGGMAVTGPLDPVVVTVPGLPGTITAAAWSAPYFYLLGASTHQFWRLDPEGRVLSAPKNLPTGVQPHAFGASRDSVFVVTATSAYKIPAATGYTSESGATLAKQNLVDATGAYASGFFLIGDSSNSGSTVAQMLNEASGTVSSQTKLGPVWQVASDGANFGFVTRDTNSIMRLHAVAASASLSPVASPCMGGTSAGEAGNPLSVSGQTLAWFRIAGGNNLLSLGTVSGGTCAPKATYTANTNSDPKVPGLIDADDAIFIKTLAGGSGKVLIHHRAGDDSTAASFTLDQAVGIVAIVTSSHYAIIVANGATPVVIQY